ncbi:MAG: hypothetical protein ACRDF4_05320, partial [Rhabdochlamydiaceae bacterium]
ELQSYISDEVTQAYWENYIWDPESGQPQVDGKRVLALLNLLNEAFQINPEYAEAAIALEQERVHKLSEFGEACSFFFEEVPTMDAVAVKKWFSQPHVIDMFRYLSRTISSKDSPVEADYEAVLRDYQTSSGLEKLGPVVHPVRVALTGRTFGPGLWELMTVLGKERILHRLKQAESLIP